MRTSILLTAVLAAAMTAPRFTSGADDHGQPAASANSPSVASESDATGKKQSSEKVDERAKQMLDATAALLAGIHSIEYHAEYDGSNISYVFRANGDAWRVDEFEAGGVSADSYSFNGTKYQCFVEKLSMFGESKHQFGTRPQTPFLSPISYAYYWAHAPFTGQPGGTRRSWDELRRRETWNELAKRAKFIRELKADGKRIATVEIERPSPLGKTFVFAVDFDEDHGGVPTGWTMYSMPEHKSSCTCVAKRWTDAEAGGGRRVQVPIEVELSGGRFEHVVADSVRINQQIDPAVFTLSKDRAKMILPPQALDEKTAEFFKNGPPLAERLTSAQDDARRNYQRVLLVVGDANSDASQRLEELREKDWRRALYEYQQVAIGQDDADAVAALKKSYPDIAGLRWPALVALDETGKVLGSIELSLSVADTRAGSAKALEFLVKHALQKLDAEKLLADAFAQARREDKNVFLEETGIYCKPCKLLSLYWEKHQAALDPNYVFLKIDPRYANGPEVMKRFRPQSGGIPWVAVLDPDGKVLTSFLGFPSDASGIEEFVELLKITAPRLTSEQLEGLRNDLHRK